MDKDIEQINIGNIIKFYVIGISTALFLCYGPIIVNIGWDTYPPIRQSFDKINRYCGDIFTWEQNCFTIQVDGVFAILIPHP